jgi:hypothetical protein
MIIKTAPFTPYPLKYLLKEYSFYYNDKIKSHHLNFRGIEKNRPLERWKLYESMVFMSNGSSQWNLDAISLQKPT